MAAAELIGDLAVLYTELAARPRPDAAWVGTGRPSTHERYHAWFDFGDHLFRLAIEAGIAADAPPAPAALANLRAVITTTDEASLVQALADALDDGFSYAGYEYGYFYGGQSWPTLCWFRSGVVFLAAFAGLTLDPEYIEDNMARYGLELFEDVAAPPGMPTHHWWWFRDSP